MSLQLDNLVKSIRALERSAKVARALDSFDADLQETIRAGVIKNFEVAYEQSWKMMKRWLEDNMGHAYTDGVPRRELFRLAAENSLITDVDHWFDYHLARNVTSHTYDEDAAQSVFEQAISFIDEANRFLRALEERND